MQHTSLNTDHSLLRDESPSVWLHTGRRRESEKISPKIHRMKLCAFLCVHVQEESEAGPCGHRVTSPCLPLFYDIMMQQGSETWHMQAIYFLTGSVTLRG